MVSKHMTSLLLIYALFFAGVFVAMRVDGYGWGDSFAGAVLWPIAALDLVCVHTERLTDNHHKEVKEQ